MRRKVVHERGCRVNPLAALEKRLLGGRKLSIMTLFVMAFASLGFSLLAVDRLSAQTASPDYSFRDGEGDLFDCGPGQLTISYSATYVANSGQKTAEDAVAALRAHQPVTVGQPTESYFVSEDGQRSTQSGEAKKFTFMDSSKASGALRMTMRAELFDGQWYGTGMFCCRDAFVTKDKAGQ